MSSATTPADQLVPSSLSANAIRSAPYSFRAPSPPFIHIPAPQRCSNSKIAMELRPPSENIDPDQLSGHDLQVITGNTVQVALDPAVDWDYQDRHRAQAILDFLHLGPTSVTRDHAFLQREGITMILVVRPSLLAKKKPLSVEAASNNLKIPAYYIHVDGLQGLIREFSEAIRVINSHLLAVNHSQSSGGSNGDGRIIAPSGNFRRGKVLVTCESGNDWSAAIVAAYVMSVFRQGMVEALQFIGRQRFCCVFDEDTKRILQSWQQILLAGSAVAQHRRRQHLEAVQPEQNGLCPDGPLQNGRAMGTGSSSSKRRWDDMMGMGEDDCQSSGEAHIADLDRFTDRPPFAPFADVMNGN
ncbi:FMI2 protein [Metarhizium album ARSEF 1941]|uniref:FMI2 protein n=1 Tax=Metarhizium album (strain ARSEF 1941) TaxID=1081103 RepID=A0A0B2WRH3_METAS|nr:FMI2 protein [Metarhizium album ARSEF 1941]KHN96209.1 FMI2 protein [Metarhizium album ARSEF 1941]